MTQIINYPLSSTFAGVNKLQANGIIDTGNNLPNGIPGALVISNSAMLATINQSMTPTATGIRSEITMPACTPTGEYWFYWEFMLPTGFAPLLDPIILMQIHTPDADPVNPIPFAFQYQQPGYLAISVPSQTLPASGSSTTIVGSINPQYNHWYQACFHVNWQPNSNGFREFFIDGQPLFRQYNVATTYNDLGNGGNYFKVGCYDGTHNARFGSCQMYVRNANCWTGNDGYQQVMGRLPLPRTLLTAL
ncbi:MAG TPA: heparin lyase I family protein [Rickettsiales bacterium]|nr:heparin lyase I family protein [Rickettsiales bacterium]